MLLTFSCSITIGLYTHTQTQKQTHTQYMPLSVSFTVDRGARLTSEVRCILMSAGISDRDSQSVYQTQPDNHNVYTLAGVAVVCFFDNSIISLVV